MKKTLKTIITVLTAGILFTGTAFAAGNYTKGLDIAFGPELAMTDYKFQFTDDDTNYEDHYKDIIAKLKISTYDCFLSNDTVGVYAELGIPFGGHRWYKWEDGSSTTDSDKGIFQGGIEFMAGPAFGINLGSSDIRLQGAVGFHMKYLAETKNDLYVKGDSMDYTDWWMGIGCDIQARFMADRRFSPIVGVTAVF